MKADGAIPEFTLFGGPLHRLGCRLRLVRGDNTLWLGVVLGLLSWSVLVLFTLLQGTGDRLFSLTVVGVHVRFLVAVPLFFLCETQVMPRMAEFVRNIVASSVVPPSEQPALAAVTRQIHRLRDSWLAEVLLLLVVFVVPMLQTMGLSTGRTGNAAWILAQSGGLTLVNVWYLGFCLPLFRFLVGRWLWHLGLWCYFLWRAKNLNLHLIPTHAGGAAGLGYLEIVHEHFTPLAFAISAVFSAAFAEDLLSGAIVFEALYHLVPMVLLVTAVLFIGPLLIFSGKLWKCRIQGVNDYMIMAHKYVDAFDRKWIRGKEVSGDEQLGTSDLQSLADLTNSVQVVLNMRWVTVSRKLMTTLFAGAILPLLPLVLFKYPLADVAAKLFQAISGL